jgi:ABC-type spermidine/putrescine transport system permease subunit II
VEQAPGLASITWLYVAWSLVPVLIAMAFSFNRGRSRSSWQGFSVRWWWTDGARSGATRAAAGRAQQPDPRRWSRS